jgi:hypothetical protein
VYPAFFDRDEALINKGPITETQHTTEVDTQTTPMNIEGEPLFEDEIASQAT